MRVRMPLVTSWRRRMRPSATLALCSFSPVVIAACSANRYRKGNVLAQEDSDRTDYRFPVAVADTPAFADVSVPVRCKPVDGSVDRACGIVWRYQNENNYYLTRANALEHNVCWYYVQNGRRVEVKRMKVKVASGVWHTLRADMRGDHVEVYFNDKKVIDAHDSRFTTPGKVGVWTKADSRTLFDDLTATTLRP
jgi:hypothetical protein